MNFLKKNRKGLIAGALVIIAALFVYQIWYKSSAVAVYSVVKQDYVPSLIISGEIVPETSTVLSAQGSGKVVQCLVEKGDSVQKGQILVQLDDRLAKMDVDRAQAAVRMAQLDLQQAATVTMEENRLASIQADLELEKVQKDSNRTRTLWQAGAVSQQEMELAEMNLKIADEKARAAQMVWQAYLNGGVNLGILQTEVQQRRLDLTDKQVTMEQYQVAAPYDGQILELYVGAGELLQAGSKVAFISSSQYSRVRIRPDQRYAAMAALGNKASVWIPSQAGNKWEAQVVAAEPVGNSDQGTVTVELSLYQNIPDLYPGQLVSVQLYGEVATQAIIIPEAYLDVQQGKNGVWMVQNGRAHFTELQVGLQTPEGALIQSGLREGDLLLLPPGLQEGQRVTTRIEGKQ